MARHRRICLLPGLLCDASVWAAQCGALSDTGEIYAPDFRGLDSFEAMAVRALDEAPGRLCVAGHSMGGRVAMEMHRLAPSRIERLALLDTGFHGPRPEEAASRNALVQLAYDRGMAALAAAWLPPMLHPARLADTELMARLTAMVCRFTPQDFEGQQRAGLTRPDAGGQLRTITCPTLVLCGRQDGWSPLPQHEEMAARIAGSALTVVEDCGHMSTVERPAEVSDALRGWLATG
jgi:pimeloyl-ACP methyl ester carboxylesterase